MSYIYKDLMYKNLYLGKIEMSNHGRIYNITNIDNIDKYPLGCKIDNGVPDIDWISDWWQYNSIPVDRNSVKYSLECIGIESVEEFKLLSHGLSLTNNFWVKDCGENINWEDINYWDNPISDEIGNALYNHKPLRKNFVFDGSPDASLNGVLKKKCKYNNGNYYLIKGGSVPNNQEPFNEVLASSLFSSINFPCAKYIINPEDNKSCICKFFTSKELELIPIAQIWDSLSRKYNENNELDFFYRLLDYYNVNINKKYINDMLCIDYIIANTDRHYGNIGILYNNVTEELCLAPAFDNGTSMWCSLSDLSNMYDDKYNIARPFCNKTTYGYWNEQIKFINDYPNLKKENLMICLIDYISLLKKYSTLNNNRIYSLGIAVIKRAKNLQEYLLSKKHNLSISDDCIINDYDIKKASDLINEIVYDKSYNSQKEGYSNSLAHYTILNNNELNDIIDEINQESFNKNNQGNISISEDIIESDADKSNIVNYNNEIDEFDDDIEI